MNKRDPPPPTFSFTTQLQRQGRGNGVKELFIMDALTDLLASEDTAVVNAACLGLLDLVELRTAAVADYIITSRRFATTLVCALLVLSLISIA